jgi:hypothetical protein
MRTKEHDDCESWTVPNYLSWVRCDHAMFVVPKTGTVRRLFQKNASRAILGVIRQ